MTPGERTSPRQSDIYFFLLRVPGREIIPFLLNQIVLPGLLIKSSIRVAVIYANSICLAVQRVAVGIVFVRRQYVALCGVLIGRLTTDSPLFRSAVGYQEVGCYTDKAGDERIMRDLKTDSSSMTIEVSAQNIAFTTHAAVFPTDAALMLRMRIRPSHSFESSPHEVFRAP